MRDCSAAAVAAAVVVVVRQLFGEHVLLRTVIGAVVARRAVAAVVAVEAADCSQSCLADQSRHHAAAVEHLPVELRLHVDQAVAHLLHAVHLAVPRHLVHQHVAHLLHVSL